MRLYFRWKLFLGFFGFAVIVAGVLVAWLLAEISQGRLFPGSPEMAAEIRHRLFHFLRWALLILGGVSIPPAIWIARRLNRPLRLLHEGMRQVAEGRLETVVLRLRTYDEFEPLIDNFNRMVSGLRELERHRESLLQTRLQLQIAREIQRNLLPSHPPTLAGFDIAGASHSAQEVGGDYFDYLPMDDGRLGLVIGDVTGHGIGSALVMAAARTCLRSLSAASFSLEEILRQANTVLHQSTPDNCFVTLALVQLDAAADVFRYASCGHSTGYLLDRSGRVRTQLKSTAPPLGCLEELPGFAIHEFPIEPGDVLVMLTDGVTEAQSPEKQFFGDQRALDLVRSKLHAPAAEIVDALHRAARNFCQSHATPDDITSLVAKMGSVKRDARVATA